MVAGRELDTTVALEIMGWEITHRAHRVRTGADYSYGVREICGMTSKADCLRWISQVCPRYSEDISAAWEVVEKMHSRGFSMMAEWDAEDRMWFVGFSNKESYKAGEASTAPHAICLAALKSDGALPTPGDET